MAEPALSPTEPIAEPVINYVFVHPGMVGPRPGFAESLSGNFSVDALVVGTYDSGLVPSALIPGIDAVTQRGIPVFGVRHTLFASSYPITLD